LIAIAPATGHRDGYADPVRNAAADEFEVDLWTLSQFILERTVPVIGIHPYPLNEQLLAAAAVCRLKPGIVFDWGTHRGSSARLFWECAKAFRLECPIHSVDLPPDVTHVEHPGDERGRLVRGLENVHLHLGDGVSVALAQWERAGRPARPLFFVDGDHAYESVFNELRRIFDAVPDASALVHDTFFQSPESGYNVGPAEAVRRIIALDPPRFTVLDSGPGLPGMTLLASKAALARVG
jgi:hypothetical protein